MLPYNIKAISIALVTFWLDITLDSKLSVILKVFKSDNEQESYI